MCVVVGPKYYSSPSPYFQWHRFMITVSINNKIMSKSSEFHIYATDIVAWAHKKVLNICQDQQQYVHNSHTLAHRHKYDNQQSITSYRILFAFHGISLCTNTLTPFACSLSLSQLLARSHRLSRSSFRFASRDICFCHFTGLTLLVTLSWFDRYALAPHTHNTYV